MWNSGWFAAVPDGGYFLDLMYGKNKGLSNHARFDLPAFNAVYDRQRELPDGPEREALIAQAKKLAAAYLPYKPTVHSAGSWLTRAGVVGYRPHPYLRDVWRYVDVETPAAP
jgi:ABC-type transport system substrate-binding protein